MNKNTKWFNFKFFVSKIATVIVMIGSAATVYGCRSLFHEEKVPNTLLNNHPFASKE